MDLFCIKNNANEVVASGFSSKALAKEARNKLNIEAGQSEKERLFFPKFKVSPSKDYSGNQYPSKSKFK